MRSTLDRIGSWPFSWTLCLLLLVIPTSASASFPSDPLSHVWCPRLEGDSVCRWRGSVRVADRVGASLNPEELLPFRQSRLIGGEGTWVFTGPNAVARLIFRKRARCSLGGDGEPGEYFAHPGEEVLFEQSLGYSTCTSSRGGGSNETSVLCSPEEKCPATLRWNGTYFVKTDASEAAASVTDTYVRRIRIVVCSGYVHVRAEDENSSAESTGRANFLSHWLIVVEETTSTSYEEDVGSPTTGSSHSVHITVSQREPGRGACESKSIEEQEHTVS
jgi:hypothetical protein